MTEKPKIMTLRAVLQVFVFIFLVPFLPLLVSARWGWGEAWAYALLNILGFFVSRLLAARRHPDLLAERARIISQADAKPGDKRLVLLMGIVNIVAMLAAGLEHRLESPPSFPPGVKAAALVIILAGYAISAYALVENRFFSGVVRIQKERGHAVVTSGPYRWVRHPGYAGGLLLYLATPFYLDAPWAFLPVGVMAILLVVRTALEDRTLHAELEGYDDYARRTRYRLIPGIW